MNDILILLRGLLYLQKGDCISCCLELLADPLPSHPDQPDLPVLLQPPGSLHGKAGPPSLLLPPHTHRGFHYAADH